MVYIFYLIRVPWYTIDERARVRLRGSGWPVRAAAISGVRGALLRFSLDAKERVMSVENI